MTSKYLQNEDLNMPVIMLSSGSFEENYFDPVFVGEMGKTDDWLRRNINENKQFSLKINEGKTIKDENENIFASRRNKVGV